MTPVSPCAPLERAAVYGDAEEGHCRIAVLWGAYLCCCVSASDVAAMMMLKPARSENGSVNPDDYVDMTGYAALVGLPV